MPLPPREGARRAWLKTGHCLRVLAPYLEQAAPRQPDLEGLGSRLLMGALVPASRLGEARNEGSLVQPRCRAGLELQALAVGWTDWTARSP